MSYKCCVVPQCKSTSIKTPDKVFVSVPTKVRLRKKWLKLAGRDPNSIVSHSNVFMCEDHFDMQKAVKNYMKYKMGFSHKLLLSDEAVPTKFHCQEDRKTWLSSTGYFPQQKSDVPQQRTESDGSVSHTTGPAEGMVEVKIEQVYVNVDMQDPLQQDQHSLKDDQVQIEPHMSAVPEIKIEVEEDDYRAMFFRMQEEVTALRITNQSLSEANQILTEQNQKLAKEIETLLEKNKNLATVIEYKNKEHVIFTERIRELTVHNQCLAEKIISLTEKCTEEHQSEDLRSDSDVLQNIGDLTKKLQDIVEENKMLNNKKERLVQRSREMGETVNKLVEDNKRLKLKIKMVLKRKQRLKNCTAVGEKMESRRERDKKTI